jgi:hypothetical protein
MAARISRSFEESRIRRGLDGPHQGFAFFRQSAQLAALGAAIGPDLATLRQHVSQPFCTVHDNLCALLISPQSTRAEQGPALRWINSRLTTEAVKLSILRAD